MVRTSEPATSSRRSERMVTLLAILREHGEVQLRDIATTLGTSVATIRRDVAVLAEQGLLFQGLEDGARTQLGNGLGASPTAHISITKHLGQASP